MSVLGDGLPDVSVPTPEVVQSLRNALDRLRTDAAMRGGGRDFREEDRHSAASKWLSELERAVLRR